jgi:hypothetical protein
VKLARDDIVPTDTNLADQHGSFADLEAATCRAFMTMVNSACPAARNNASLAQTRRRFHRRSRAVISGLPDRPLRGSCRV